MSGGPGAAGGGSGARRLTAGELELAGVFDGQRAFVGPEQVVIDLTNRCNNNCIGCWTRSPLLRDREPSERWKELEIPFDAVIRLIEDLHALGTRRVRFTGGGEPLMHPRIDDILAHCKELQLITCLTTNGSLLTTERARRFAELPLDEVAVSLWAASPEIYSRTHPNKTGRTWRRIAANLAELCRRKRVRPRVTLSNVLFAMNHSEAFQMYRFARELGADAVYYTVLDPIEGRTDGLLLRPEHVDTLEPQLDRIACEQAALPAAERLELENWEGFRRRIRSIRVQQRGDYDAAVIDEIPCYVGWVFCRVMANGDVAPCCRGTELPLGNINTHGFREIWHGPRYSEFRRRALTLSKRDPYFAPIGCHRTCDNLMHNEQLHQRLIELPAERRETIQQATGEEAESR